MTAKGVIFEVADGSVGNKVVKYLIDTKGGNSGSAVIVTDQDYDKNEIE